MLASSNLVSDEYITPNIIKLRVNYAITTYGNLFMMSLLFSDTGIFHIYMRREFRCVDSFGQFADKAQACLVAINYFKFHQKGNIMSFVVDSHWSKLQAVGSQL